MKTAKKLLILLTAIFVMMSVVMPASAFTSQNIVTMDFSSVVTDENGKVTSPNGVYTHADKNVAKSAVYYDDTTDTLSIVCAKDETAGNGRMGFYNTKSNATATDTVKLSTKIDLTHQTGDVQIRLWGYYYDGSSDKSTQKETITIDKDGKVKLFGGATSIVLEKKGYDVTLYYTPAKKTNVDGTVSVGKATAKLIFESGNEVYTTDWVCSDSLLNQAGNFYNVSYIYFYAMKNAAADNVFKINGKVTLDTVPGIEKKREVYFSHNFDNDTAVTAPSGASYTRISSAQNGGELVEAIGGAKSGKSLKVSVGGDTSAQFRINKKNITSAVPVGFEVSAKLEKLDAQYLRINMFNQNVVVIANGGVVKLGSESLNYKLDANEWYTFKGYYNPANGIASLSVYNSANEIVAGKNATIAQGTFANDYVQIVFEKDAIGYLDDVCLYRADGVLGTSAATLGIASMSPMYGERKAEDSAIIEFTKAIAATDFEKGNIIVKKDGAPFDDFGYNWSADKKTLNITGLGVGKYEINVLGVTDGESSTDAYMEFELMAKPTLKDVTFEQNDGKITATLVAPYQMNSVGAFKFYLAGYDADGNMQEVAVTNCPTADGSVNKVYSAELDGEHTKICAYVFDNDLRPLKDVAHFPQNRN